MKKDALSNRSVRIRSEFFVNKKKNNLMLKIVGAVFLSMLLGICSLDAQWTNTAGLTEHDHPTDDILFSGASTTGTGVKLFYANSKFSFRGGQLTFSGPNNWDVDSLGFRSFSYGVDTRATGVNSVAFGDRTYANGTSSMSIGTITESHGLNSFAGGNGCITSGSNSFSFGSSNTCSASSSAVFGISSTVSGSNSFSIGGLNTVSGSLGTTVIGYLSSATASRATAIGYNLSASATGAFVMGGSHTNGPFWTLTNDIAHSMMFGFNSNIPTFFIGPSNGANTTGLVGIATTTPQEKLDIDGALRISNTTTNNAGTIRYNGSDFQGYDGASWLSLTTQNTDSQTLNLSGNVLSISGGNNVTIPSGLWSQSANDIYYTTGNVGIGTNTAAEELHIHSTDQSTIKFTNSSAPTDGFEVGFSTGNNKRAKLWNKEDAHLVFGTNDLERVRIHKSGSVSIRGDGIIPQQQLDVDGAINVSSAVTGTAGAIQWTGTDFEGYDGTSWVSLTDGGSAMNSPWTQSGTDVYYNVVGGKVGIGTNDPSDELHVEGNVGINGQINHPSDERLKEEIVDLENTLKIIAKLQPKQYKYSKKAISQFAVPEKIQYGLIAQEVAEVLPSLVIENFLVDEDGTEYMGMNYEQLVPILLSSIKELHAEKEELLKKVDKNTAQIETLIKLITDPNTQSADATIAK